MLLEDSVAFVTGATSGIGAAGARAMAGEGALVIFTDRDGSGADAWRRESARPATRRKP